MLGTDLSLLLEKYGIPFIGTDREADITDPDALRDFIQAQPEGRSSFEWIINCAAYTAVDKAEEDRENSRRLNTIGPGNIAAIANETGARLIHISTDYVFNGRGNKPYTEEDIPDPIGIYGITKRDGEKKVLEGNTKSCIIRTAWLYGKYGNNFVHTMLKLMNERDEIKVVNDQWGSPTWTNDLARAITDFIRMTDEGRTIPYGIYHFTNEGKITWFDFAGKIYTLAKTLGILTKDCKIIPCTSADFPAKVKRPAYSVLDKAKIKKALGITIPVWDESLKKFLSAYA